MAPVRDDVLDASSPRARDLLAGYMAAWKAFDAGALRAGTFTPATGGRDSSAVVAMT